MPFGQDVNMQAPVQDAQVTVGHALSVIVSRLKAAHPSCDILDPIMEGELLLAHVLGMERWQLRIRHDYLLDSFQYQRVLELADRRAAGEPSAYILGSREFWSRNFLVTNHTLIPRPETELLVETALELVSAGELNSLPQDPLSYRTSKEGDQVRNDQDSSLFILDAGTGCGIIAITLALEIPGCSVVATDISMSALETAQRNIRAHHLWSKDRYRRRISLVNADWLSCFRTGPLFHLVVSNPPYIGTHESGTLSIQVIDHEPAQALFAGKDGLEAIRKLIRTVPSVLKPGGWFLCEIGFMQGETTKELASRYFDRVQIRKDLSGKDRLLTARIAP